MWPGRVVDCEKVSEEEVPRGEFGLDLLVHAYEKAPGRGGNEKGHGRIGIGGASFRPAFQHRTYASRRYSTVTGSVGLHSARVGLGRDAESSQRWWMLCERCF